MWTYNQSDGTLAKGGATLGIGYSGFDAGKNMPSAENEPSIGPIPRGRWKIGNLYQSENHGPDCMPLTPCDGTETFGRSGFLLHGDSILHPGSASHGCIIMPRSVRLEVASSGDMDLEVI